MIRSNWQTSPSTGESERDEPSANAVGMKGRLFFAMLCLVASTALAGLLKSQTLTPLELLLWRPLLVVVASIVAAVVWSAVGKRDVAQTWKRILGYMPLACLGAVLVNLLGVWPQSIISAPLVPLDALKFLATLGLAVTNGGPDGYLRGLAWMVAVAVFWIAWRERRDLVWSLIDALLVWLSMSLAWLLPSVVLWLVAGAANLNALGDTRRLFMEFSQSTLGSYWINLQLLRWFTGFGDQLSVSYALFSSAWVWVAGIAVWSAWPARDWWYANIKRVDWREMSVVALSLAVGFTAAWSRGGWSTLDVGAWLVWIGLLFLVLMWHAAGDGLAAPEGFWWLVLLGAGVLGWPVVLAVGVVVAVEYGFKNKSDIGVSSGLVWLLDFARWVALALLAYSFARRGLDAKPDSIRLLASGLVLLVPLALSNAFGLKVRSWWLLATWLAAAALSALALWTFAPLAIVLLAVAASHVTLRFKPDLAKYLPWLMYFLAWMLLAALVWLPRLLNPRLVPMQ